MSSKMSQYNYRYSIDYCSKSAAESDLIKCQVPVGKGIVFTTIPLNFSFENVSTHEGRAERVTQRFI